MKNKILVVEDDPAFQEIIKEYLEGEYTIFVVETAQEAIKFLQEVTLVALIVDLGLPDLNGIEIVKEARAEHSNLPIIVLTSDKMSDSVQKAVDAGADDYIAKPPEKKILSERLKRAIYQKLISR